MKITIKYIVLTLITLSLFSFLNPPTKIFGDFKIIKMQTYKNNALQSTFFNGLVKLYPEAMDPRFVFKADNIAHVSLNNKPLKYQTNIKSYNDSIERLVDEGSTWAVSTNNVFSSFTYSCSINYPIFNSIQNIPDTIRKSENYSIDIGGVQNADFVEFIFDDLIFHPQVPWYRKINTSINNVIVIPGSAFNEITSQNGFVRLVFTKGEDKMIDGKNFRFENRLMLVKPVLIIN